MSGPREDGALGEDVLHVSVTGSNLRSLSSQESTVDFRAQKTPWICMHNWMCKGNVAPTHAHRNVDAAALKVGDIFLSSIFFIYNLKVNLIHEL